MTKPVIADVTKAVSDSVKKNVTDKNQADAIVNDIVEPAVIKETVE